MGKKLGIVAVVFAVLYVILTIIVITQMPEIDDEVYKLAVTDQEQYAERLKEITDNGSTLFKVADKCSNYVALLGIIVSIVSLVKLIKDKEKGKVFPILAIVIIVVCFFVSAFSIVDTNQIFRIVVEPA